MVELLMAKGLSEKKVLLVYTMYMYNCIFKAELKYKLLQEGFSTQFDSIY